MNDRKNTLSAISLFSGAGGMDLGFERAGFDVHWSNDLDGTACETYQTNFQTENVSGPIELLAKSLKRFSDVDCVFGGPPCQGFSVAGKMDLDDPRSKLVYQFMDIISALRPKSFVMENVPSLATLNKFSKFREQLVKHAHSLGYATDLQIFSSSEFGVPQDRRRMFFVGVLGNRDVDLRQRSRAYLKTAPSTLEAISDLGIQGSDQNPCTCNAAVTIAASPVLRKSPYAGMLFNGAGRPIHPNRVAPTLPASMGGNRTPILDERLYYGDGFDWISMYHTHLIQGGDPYSKHAVPSSLRRLTIRESSRLHGFPDDFIFCGPKTAIYRQIGNSVPPTLAQTIAAIVRDILANSQHE
jgi:DNA (cytosine-5)-methyltransferase 1